MQVRVLQSESVPGQSAVVEQPKHEPEPLHFRPLPQSVLAGANENEGPWSVHSAMMHGVPVSGRSWSGTFNSWPSPSHWMVKQSPTVWKGAVPGASGLLDSWPWEHENSMQFL